MSPHSRRPWRVVLPPSSADPRLYIVAEYSDEEKKKYANGTLGGQWIAEVRPYRGAGQMRADAALIAAAPDLLAVTKRAIQTHGPCIAEGCWCTPARLAVEAAESDPVIALAQQAGSAGAAGEGGAP